MSLLVEMMLRAVEDRFLRAARACALCALAVPHAAGFDQHALEYADGTVTLRACAARAIWSRP